MCNLIALLIKNNHALCFLLREKKSLSSAIPNPRAATNFLLAIVCIIDAKPCLIVFKCEMCQAKTRSLPSENTVILFLPEKSSNDPPLPRVGQRDTYVRLLLTKTSLVSLHCLYVLDSREPSQPVREPGRKQSHWGDCGECTYCVPAPTRAKPSDEGDHRVFISRSDRPPIDDFQTLRR